MGTKTVIGGGFDVLGDVARFGKVDECLSSQVSRWSGLFIGLSYGCTHLLAHSLLLISRVNCYDVQTHCFGVLLRQSSETTTSANNRDSLAWFSTGFLQTLVHGNLRNVSFSGCQEMAGSNLHPHRGPERPHREELHQGCVQHA